MTWVGSQALSALLSVSLVRARTGPSADFTPRRAASAPLLYDPVTTRKSPADWGQSRALFMGQAVFGKWVSTGYKTNDFVKV